MSINTPVEFQCVTCEEWGREGCDEPGTNCYACRLAQQDLADELSALDGEEDPPESWEPHGDDTWDPPPRRFGWGP